MAPDVCAMIYVSLFYKAFEVNSYVVTHLRVCVCVCVCMCVCLMNSSTRVTKHEVNDTHP